MGIDWLIAVPAAVGAAACFGIAGVLQHRATHRTKQRRPLSPWLLVDLIGMRVFRSGVLLGVLGFVLQVLALRYGTLILVQPILVTGVLFYLIVASALDHRPPDRVLLGGALMALAGLSAFLVVANPSSGADSLQSSAAIPLGLSLVAVVALCLLAASRMPHQLRSLPLAAATAVCYGATAGLVRSLTSASLGWGIFSHWELYAIAVLGPVGFLLNQDAYQSGMLGSVALTMITVGDPIVAIVIGITWLGESIATGWLVAGEVLALAVMAGGILILAHRAQHLAERMKAAGARPAEAQ
ncbi:MAG: DMT family transporter [Nocardioidaceae bacterium]